MPTSKTWNNTTYQIPTSGEVNWDALTTFLSDVADNAQTVNSQKFAARVATSTPVTVSGTTDCVVVTNLTVAGAVAVTLPAGVTGKMIAIVDGKGDANTNNITITPASGTINGSATYVIDGARNGVVLVYSGSEWVITSEFIASSSGFIARSQIAAGTADHVVINSGTGALSSEANLAVSRGGTNSGTALSNNRVMKSSGGAIVEAAAITASKALVSDANGIPVAATPSTTEINFVAGVTAAIQTQIDGKQPLDSDLTAVAGLSATGLIARTGAGTAASRTVTAGSTKVSVSNGDGVAGNPTVDVTEANINVGNLTGTLAIGHGGTGQTTQAAAFDALSPTTTKGDIAVFDTTTNQRLPVGTDGQFLKADSTASVGVAWSDAANGSGEINVVTNPSAASATTGYTAGTSHSVARDTANSPLSPTTATSVKVTATATAAESSTSGVYYTISTHPTGLRNKKLKFEFYFTSEASQTWAISI